MKFILMAGGSGTKLWPISRETAPKQFLPLIGKKTLFQMNVEALLERFAPHDIFISTTADYIRFVKEQTPQIPKENYIIEPRLGKDSGPASCYAMAKVAHQYPDEVVTFYVQSVCTRNPTDKFLDMHETMEQLVRKNGKLTTGTIIPKYLETGSDLIELGNKSEEPLHNHTVYDITGWVDVVKNRMTMQQVEEVTKNHTVGIHCNHWTWTPEHLFAAVQEHRPDWYAIVQKLQAVFGTQNEQEKIDHIYAEFEPGRIELVTRKLVDQNKVQAVLLPYDWTHITTWDDVYRYYEKEGIPTHSTQSIEVDSANNLILSSGKKLISLVGMNNMVVIETADSILICPRDQANKVKEVNDILKTRGYSEYL